MCWLWNSEIAQWWWFSSEGDCPAGWSYVVERSHWVKLGFLSNLCVRVSCSIRKAEPASTICLQWRWVVIAIWTACIMNKCFCLKIRGGRFRWNNLDSAKMLYIWLLNMLLCCCIRFRMISATLCPSKVILLSTAHLLLSRKVSSREWCARHFSVFLRFVLIADST